MKAAALALVAALSVVACSAEAEDAARTLDTIRLAAALPDRPDGPVLDQADILPAEAEARVETRLRELFAATGDAVVLVSVNSLHDRSIEDYSMTLFNRWEIGSPGGRGLLVLVAPNERKVRIEVGCAAESTVSNAAAAEIIDTRMLPRFREGELSAGTLAGVDALIAHLALTRPANDAGPHSEACKARLRSAA